ncbi:PilX N-terminal domain-containing pilus assembly protein [Echinimonas agarilytica]|uniref:Type 4 fimbrial biogenesis protein PilX N-terminal domain-containing protein n=1 Tax=Echinimonas agarilytica TaxID=1215918 RepID=A0AA41W9F8_9GAMM|nr:PilX N-terminal domain-containing pilus assembly protein [Echinimonas agarilytica]MCM2680609.1 hypothetical protein [Echinimonas agarilytica]
MRPIHTQSGAALVVSLVILLVLTLTGVLALNRSTMQQKMATLFDASGMAFDAAEVAIDGVVFEQEDVTLDANLRVLTIAQGAASFDPEIDSMECHDANWTSRTMTSSGMTKGAVHSGTGSLHADPELNSWSKVAYVGEGLRVPAGWGFNQGFHYFQVRGCGHVAGERTTTANELQIYLLGPKSE